MNKSTIRSAISSDLPAVKAIIDAVELFPAEMLDDMFHPESGGPEQTEFWLTFDDGSPVAIAYCAPEAMTVGTWNLLLIAVHPDRQGQGIGRQVMAYFEEKQPNLLRAFYWLKLLALTTSLELDGSIRN